MKYKKLKNQGEITEWDSIADFCLFSVHSHIPFPAGIAASTVASTNESRSVISLYEKQ